MTQTPPSLKPPGAFRFVGAVFGLVFAGVGLTVIGNLWFGEMGEMAPTFFKLVGSLISIAFIGMGGTLAVSSIFGGGMMGGDQLVERAQQLQRSMPTAPPPPKSPTSAGPGSYVCPNCGGTLARADVSPLGDVKCSFCGAWFNIHGKT